MTNETVQQSYSERQALGFPKGNVDSATGENIWVMDSRSERMDLSHHILQSMTTSSLRRRHTKLRVEGRKPKWKRHLKERNKKKTVCMKPPLKTGAPYL